jgi:hypothetical protein
VHKRHAGVLEESLARSCQLDAMNAARQQLDPDLLFEISDLPT